MDNSLSSFHLEITLGQALGFSSALVKRKVIDKRLCLESKKVLMIGSQ